MEVQKARQEWGRVRSSRVWQLPCLCVLGALTEKVSRHGHMCHTPPIPATASPPASHDSPPNASISSSLVAISYLLLSLWFVRGFLSSLQSPLAFREVQTRFLLTKRKEKKRIHHIVIHNISGIYVRMFLDIGYSNVRLTFWIMMRVWVEIWIKDWHTISMEILR